MGNFNEALARQEAVQSSQEVVEKSQERETSGHENLASAEQALEVLKHEKDRAERALEKGPLSNVPEAMPITQNAEAKLQAQTTNAERLISQAAQNAEQTPAAAPVDRRTLRAGFTVVKTEAGPVLPSNATEAQGAPAQTEVQEKPMPVSGERRSLRESFSLERPPTPIAESAPATLASPGSAETVNVESKPLDNVIVLDRFRKTVPESAVVEQPAPSAEISQPMPVSESGTLVSREVGGSNVESKPLENVEVVSVEAPKLESVPAVPPIASAEIRTVTQVATGFADTLTPSKIAEALAPTEARPNTLVMGSGEVAVDPRAFAHESRIGSLRLPESIAAKDEEVTLVVPQSFGPTGTLRTAEAQVGPRGTLRVAETAKPEAPVSLEDKRAARTEKLKQARSITEGLALIAGYSTAESIAQRQDRISKIMVMQEKLKNFVRANPELAGTLGDELSKLHGALEDNKGIQERAIAERRAEDAKAPKAEDIQIELETSAEELSVERTAVSLGKKFETVEKMDPNVWDEAYLGFGVDWKKEEWEALSSTQKPGAPAPEKEMFKQMRIQTLGSLLELDRLNGEMKTLHGKIKDAESRGMGETSTEVLQLQRQERDLLLQIRKVEDLKVQNQNAELALQTMVLERLSKGAESSENEDEDELEAKALAEANAREAQALESSAKNVVVPVAQKEGMTAGKVGMMGAIGAGGFFVGGGYLIAKGIGKLLKGVGWVLDSFAKSKNFGDALNDVWSKATKKLNDAYDKNVKQYYGGGGEKK